VEPADDEPEELVPGAEAGTALATEGDLEPVAEEQVLAEEALAAPQGAGEGGEKEPDEFDHRGRIADRRHLAGPGADFCPPKITLVPWGVESMSEALRPLPELVDDFFGREWVRVFCGPDAAEGLQGRLHGHDVAQLSRGLASLYMAYSPPRTPASPCCHAPAIDQRSVVSNSQR
jgi:hypothetical protein